MYCPQCDLQFSGSQSGGKCPYCGKVAEPSSGGRRPAEAKVGTVSVHPPARVGGTRTERPNEWTLGALVAGKYEIVSRLGTGGFGTVYKVRHIFRKKYYALKTPHSEFVQDEVFRVRFEREIEAMERFVHADAVMIRDSGLTEAGTPYYTMDFIEGESLKAVLRREKRFSIDRALDIVRRVLRVLAVAHAHQIIHRDIKPDNVMLTSEAGREKVKVLDFGVAKLLDLVGDTESLTHGMRVGTPKYMSPEQISGDPVDARSDLFSLGVVAYEMLTGVHPFAQLRDPVRATAAILNNAAAPPRELVPEIPKTINDHVLWMLEKKAKRRPQTAEVLIEKLGALEDGVSRVEPVERLEVEGGVAREPAIALVLRQETSVGERRSFLLFREKTSFGRSNDPARDVRNDLIWRCLPCRSRTEDPENWQRNLTISHQTGTVYADGTALVIEPAPKVKYGIGIGGVRSFRPARIQSDRFHISLGDKALELDGYRVLRNTERPTLDLSFLKDTRPPDVRPPRKIGYSNSTCPVSHVRFQRASNWPLHEYFLVYKQVGIGSSANVGLRLRGSGVESAHAVVIYEGGEVFLLASGGPVLVRGPALNLRPGEGREDGLLELKPHRLLPLRPGLELILGEARLRVEAVVDSHFKTV